MIIRILFVFVGFLCLSLYYFVFVVVLGSVGVVLVKDVIWEDIVNDDKIIGDVLQYGMGIYVQCWSLFKQVNVDNVFKLILVWLYFFGDEKQCGQEFQVIVSDGVIYVIVFYLWLFVFDVKIGKCLWIYNYCLFDDICLCCDVVNCGVVIYGDKVFFGIFDVLVVVLNKNIGKVVWKKKFVDYGVGYIMIGVLIIVKDGKIGKVLLIYGSLGDEFGVVGCLFVCDLDIGEEIWMCFFVEGYMGCLNGKDSMVIGDVKVFFWLDDCNLLIGKVELWSYGGGVFWQSVSFDVEINIIIVGVGNFGLWNIWVCIVKGGNLYDYDSFYIFGQVGVDLSSGEVKWFYQYIFNDVWDFFGNNELVLFDYKVKDGKIVKVIVYVDCNGFFYVVDCSNGKLQNVFFFVDNIIWVSYIDLKIGCLVECEGQCLLLLELGQKYGKVVEVLLLFFGGKNWNLMVYSQDIGLFYVLVNYWKEDYWIEEVSYMKGSVYFGMGFWIKCMYDDYVGSLCVMDLVSGKVVWEYKEYLLFWVGVLVIVGNLVFIGIGDGYFKVFDVKSGKELWKFQIGSGIVLLLIIWEQDGEQYFGVIVGYGGVVLLWGGDMVDLIWLVVQGGFFWVFKLFSWDNCIVSC